MFDRKLVRFKPLEERENKVFYRRDSIRPETDPGPLDAGTAALIEAAGDDIIAARRVSASVILAFGAHTIKNGMAPVLKRLIAEGWVTHLATNGAGIIHDWELACQGATSEDVRANIARGEFGIWEETGLYLNLALAVGAYRGLGYGESVGSLVYRGGLDIPEPGCLREEICSLADSDPRRAAAAADLRYLLQELRIPGGFYPVKHRYPEAGLQAEAFRLGIPFTGHPMFGHDIIYTHPANLGAAVGRTAERDFLTFADSVAGLEGGVYLSVGSAVMSPMIFEKSLSMVQNVRLQDSRKITGHHIYVVDLAKPDWDWKQGEPPPENPAYFLRFLKTFHRMGGQVEYISGDNRSVLLYLYQYLRSKE